MKSTEQGSHPPSAPSARASASAAAAFSPVAGHKRPTRILVVDDDTAVREALKRLLRNAGYEVAGAANGREALKQFAGEPVDLLMLDLGLPHQSGWEVFERITNENPAVAIIILTGRTNQIRMAAAAGVGALIEKPVDPADLLRTVKEVLSEPRKVRLRRVHGRTQKIRYLPSGNTAFFKRTQARQDVPGRKRSR